MPGSRVLWPSQVTERVSWFDRFAGRVATVTARAWFFAGCVALVVVWAPSIIAIGDLNTWQLIINTVTTIVTFLLVALLQNSTCRADQAVQHKLNAVAAGLAVLMDAFVADLHHVADDGGLAGGLTPDDVARVDTAARQLRAAVGLEEYESS